MTSFDTYHSAQVFEFVAESEVIGERPGVDASEEGLAFNVSSFFSDERTKKLDHFSTLPPTDLN